MVLSCLVLITLLVVAFLTKALINSQVAYSSANQVRTDILGRSALNIVVGEIREEIRTGSTILNGGNNSYPSVYLPLATANVISQAMGVASPDTIGATTLLKVSASGVAINPSTGGRVLGSNLSISTSSSNGRSLSSTSWFGSGGPQLGSQPTLPTWVFLSRSGVVTTPSYASPTSDPNYVVGRFAYTVYDMGGLLDANVTGYPSIDAANAAFKGPGTYADLSVVSGIGSAANADSFVTWRNGIDAASVTAYESYLQSYGLKYGFLSTKSGDNAFLSRMDLIRFAQEGGYGFSSTALGYFTHFSPSLNAPSWVPPITPPGSITNYNATAESTTSPNRDIPNVRFTGITGTSSITHYHDDGTTQTYTVTPGDPLVQYRFSLAKLAWVTSEGPSANLAKSDPLYNPGGTSTTIQACFGLQWIAANDHWNYVGPTESTVQSSIETLAQVAAETTGREPNFFELLKAGILSGSLGMSAPEEYANSSGVMPGTGNMTFDAQPDLQILKIGANILNCAASDDYPIILTTSYGGTNVELAGVTDLPYLYCIDLHAFNETTASPALITALDYVFIPVFINPQRYASIATATPTSVTLGISNGTMTNTLLSVSGSSTYYLQLASLAPTLIPKSLVTTGSTPALTPITIPSSQFDQFRSGPQPQQNAAAVNTLSALVPYQTSPYPNAQAFRIFSYEKEAPTLLIPANMPPATSQGSPVINSSSLIFRLQYQARDGQMKTYYTMGGNEALASATGIVRFNGLNSEVAFGSNKTTLASTDFFACFDPRSGRLGPMWGSQRINLGPYPPLNLGSRPTNVNTQNNDNVVTFIPYYSGTSSPGVLLGLMPQGGQTQTQSWSQFGTGAYLVNTLDPDEMSSTKSLTPSSTLLRPTDGWLSTSSKWAANPYAQQSGNNLITTDESRPVILHRPYRSVAELGYVFRDSPWKTLSFFDQTSADGALLDLFSVADEPSVAAGRINLNTQQTTAWYALLNGAGQNSDGTNPLASPSVIASTYNSYAFSSGIPSTSMPWNIASLVSFMSSSKLGPAGLDSIKYHRESIVRSLAEATQTRTWNLLIDVVAQSGHYIPNAQSLNNFLVEGEKRYWLSIAIDRYTNKIVQEQLEPVDE